MLYKNDTIPDHVWTELNRRYRIDVFHDHSGCTKYRVYNKLGGYAELESYVQEDPKNFYRQKAAEIEEELEKILLG